MNIENLYLNISGFAACAAVIIFSGTKLSYYREQIAELTGMGKARVDLILMASVTSLPELVVSLAALRMGALDMAAGNLLGSNVFNIFILGIDDVFYKEGSLYRNISPTHLLSVLIIIIMTAVVCLGLLFKPKKKQVRLLSLNTFVIVILYMALMTYLFIKR